jgi:hypothetical protein
MQRLSKTVSGIRNLRTEGVNVAVLSVVRPGTSGADAYRHIRSLGWRNWIFYFWTFLMMIGSVSSANWDLLPPQIIWFLLSMP